MAGLKELQENNRIIYEGMAGKYHNHYEFQSLLNVCYGKEWVPFLKESFNSGQNIMEYIGRYTHRIAISNNRILSIDEKTVTFKVKDYRDGGIWKEETITGAEFIRRYLMHVLPKGFVKIRHYGLLSNRNKKKQISLCQNLIGCKVYLSQLKELDIGAILKLLYGVDINKCSCCNGAIQIHNDVQIRKKQLYIT